MRNKEGLKKMKKALTTVLQYLVSRIDGDVNVASYNETSGIWLLLVTRFFLWECKFIVMGYGFAIKIPVNNRVTSNSHMTANKTIILSLNKWIKFRNKKKNY